jgi:uncharacterized protein (DUF2267 family)
MPPVSVEAREIDVPSGAQVEACLAEIEASGALPDGASAAEAAMAVLCTLAHGLSRADAYDLAASLGPAARLLLQRCVVHRSDDPERFDRDSFLSRVTEHFSQPPADGERMVRVVFQAVQRLLPHHEIDHVRRQLPYELASIWRAP